jgi:flagellar biosynthesis protein FlhA
MAGPQHTTDAPGAALRGEVVLSIGILGVIAVMLVPLPTVLLDLLLALSVGLTVLLLLVTLSTRKAMELSVFPSLLLLLTLFRLSLNVATTRQILLNGHAGQLVAAFGNFVGGGNLVVGLVVFLILVVIQFVVITKGAGRVSEVSARFTLDALPGKQMAIDAELNSGAIDEFEARKRREKLSAETEFYGAMDGASKFVRGDAIAGLIVTAINLVGGILIGAKNGMAVADAVRTYSILTIGDGLISQIPALIISTTAAILTTKAGSGNSLGGDISRQLLRTEQPLWMGAGLFAALGVMPGIPTWPFFLLSGATAAIAMRQRNASTTPAVVPATASADARPGSPVAPEIDESGRLREFLLTDRAIVEVGASLAGLLQTTSTKSLPERITTLRREFSREHGLWIPPLRVRASLELPPDRYRILIAGREVGTGELRVDDHLAILPEGRAVNLPGVATTEPVFKLPARWISPSIARQAEAQGCTVVDAPSVLITHLSELLQRHGHELLGRETLKQMLDSLRDVAPALLDELKGEAVKTGTIHQVLVQLAEDRVPLADLTLVLESVINHAPQKKAVDDLCDAVRVDVGHLLCTRHLDATGHLQMLALQPQLESRLREAIADGQLAIPAQTLERLLTAISDRCRAHTRTGGVPALVVHHVLRRPLKRLLRRSLPQCGLLSFREIPPEVAIQPVALVRLDEVFDPNSEPTAMRTAPQPRTAVGVAA